MLNLWSFPDTTKYQSLCEVDSPILNKSCSLIHDFCVFHVDLVLMVTFYRYDIRVFFKCVPRMLSK